MESNESSPSHVPVLLQEVLEWMRPSVGGVCVDGTLGLAGHAREIAQQLGASGHLIGLDRDPNALELARERLAGAPCQVTLLHTPFDRIRTALSGIGVSAVNGILLDIGVSSMQLDTAERGFSFGKPGPLDMRMDPTTGLTAADLIQTEPEEELARIFYEYGEERFSRRIAKRIVEQRGKATINETDVLAQVVAAAVPRRGRIHPATRVFQALRIAVNDELGQLDRGLDEALTCLAPGGRLLLITFHSLEDRLVKQRFRRWKQEKRILLHTKKVVKPTREECLANRRARSAHLRVCERLEEDVIRGSQADDR